MATCAKGVRCSMTESDDPRLNEGPREVMIGIAYGHPSGAVQAFHPATGLKQLGDSPSEAVDELWSMLEEGDVL